jgi:hypothetical protein
VREYVPESSTRFTLEYGTSSAVYGEFTAIFSSWIAEICTVLLLGTFDRTGPTKVDDSGKSIIPHLTPDQLVKRLVAIAPKKPLIGRSSINFH